MICEKAYYPNGDETKKLNCRSKLKIQEDTLFKERCPLIYYCAISERFENTTDMFDCKYREAKND